MSVTVPVSVPVNGSCSHADDLVKIVSQPERAPDRLRISSEAARPIIVREHRVRMCARREIVALRKQPAHRRPEPEGAKHPPGDVLHVRFFHLLIRPIGQIRSVRVGNRDQVGLILDCRAHLAEHRILAAVIYSALSIETDSFAKDAVQPLRCSHR